VQTGANTEDASSWIWLNISFITGNWKHPAVPKDVCLVSPTVFYIEVCEKEVLNIGKLHLYHSRGLDSFYGFPTIFFRPSTHKLPLHLLMYFHSVTFFLRRKVFKEIIHVTTPRKYQDQSSTFQNDLQNIPHESQRGAASSVSLKERLTVPIRCCDWWWDFEIQRLEQFLELPCKENIRT
jgi:hypothetical protein